MKKILLFLSFIIIIAACSSGNNDDSTGTNDFDRTALLTHWADNIIIPSYTNYQSKVTVLNTATATFTSSPTETNLQNLRAAWLEGYKAYQTISIFNTGKAEEISLKECTNIYPTNAVGIETNIQSGTYNLALYSQFAKQGFPALDYLLNGLGSTDAAIVTFYSTNSNAANYKKYLTDVASRIKINADVVVTDWNSGYRKMFIDNNGTTVTSSVNKTTNDFVKNLEKDIRAGKLGIPAGLFSNNVKYPEKVEAFYKNNISKELLNISLKAAQDFFNGKYFNASTTGPSLKSYLDYVNAVRDSKKLSDIINNQFTTIYAVNENLSASFSNQINSDNSKIIAAYDALQLNVVYVKLDMMQALNITIDYVDGDGD